MTLEDAGVALLALAVILLTGCGAAEWSAHASAAQVVHATATSGRAALLQHRRDHLSSAGRRAMEGDQDPVAAVRAAAAEWDEEHRDLVGAFNVYAGSVNTYAAGVFSALRGEAAEVWSITRMAAHVGTAWNAVVGLLPEGVELPEIPSWILDFLIGVTSVPEEVTP
jgi:hypothetical protein